MERTASSASEIDAAPAVGHLFVTYDHWPPSRRARPARAISARAAAFPYVISTHAQLPNVSTASSAISSRPKADSAPVASVSQLPVSRPHVTRPRFFTVMTPVAYGPEPSASMPPHAKRPSSCTTRRPTALDPTPR